jgi:hypothetical protein
MDGSGDDGSPGQQARLEAEVSRTAAAVAEAQAAHARAVDSLAQLLSVQAAKKQAAKEKAYEQLLQRVATLPPDVLLIVLRPLSVIELARLSCVHKAFHVGLLCLRQQHPWRREFALTTCLCEAGVSYDSPSADELGFVEVLSRLARAAYFGDVAVIQAMVSAGVDEYGTPLLQARTSDGRRIVDDALHSGIRGSGCIQTVEMLLGAGADVHSSMSPELPSERALPTAVNYRRAHIVSLLLERGADVHADNETALVTAAQGLDVDAIALLIQYGADARHAEVKAVIDRSTEYFRHSSQEYPHILHLRLRDTRALLIQHGAQLVAPVDEEDAA